MNTHSLNTYRILSIGNGSYIAPVDIHMAGGIYGWMRAGGLLVSTILQASSEFTEAIVASLARFSNIRRFKLNCDILQAMPLDDVTFPDVFNREWNGHAVKEGGRSVPIPPFSASPDVRAMHSYYAQFFKEEIDMQKSDPLNNNVQTDAGKQARAQQPPGSKGAAGSDGWVCGRWWCSQKLKERSDGQGDVLREQWECAW